MAKTFEDQWMDIHAQMISLCLELSGTNISKVYIYGSIEEKSTSFNAFFQQNGQILTTLHLTSDRNLILKFLQLGTADLQRMKELCLAYRRTPPTEVKLVYDLATARLGSHYQYEPVCTEKTGVSAEQVFSAWLQETRNALASGAQ